MLPFELSTSQVNTYKFISSNVEFCWLSTVSHDQLCLFHFASLHIFTHTRTHLDSRSTVVGLSFCDNFQFQSAKKGQKNGTFSLLKRFDCFWCVSVWGQGTTKKIFKRSEINQWPEASTALVRHKSIHSLFSEHSKLHSSKRGRKNNTAFISSTQNR